MTQEESRILAGETQIDRSLYMDGTRDVISGDKLLPAGRIITIRPHTRFTAFPEHTHDYVEMVYMCAGETRHVINGTPILLQAGELLMLGQHARQSIEFETPEQNAVLSVLRSIEEHYADGSLTGIAGQLHYELPYLSRLIRQTTGKNYTELLQEKRLSQAAWLLRNTEKHVDEIALSVGYENISYFHRIFAARFGSSPRKYRIMQEKEKAWKMNS